MKSIKLKYLIKLNIHMKIFKKNEIILLKNLFRRNQNFNLNNKKGFAQIDNTLGNKKLNKKLGLTDNKFPDIDENLSNLLSQMENNDSADEDFNTFNQFITQKDDVIFINNTERLDFLKTLKLGDLIVLNKKYLAKSLAINNKINTFAIFDNIK